MMTLDQKYLALMQAAKAQGAPSDLLRACFCLLSTARAIDVDCAVRLKRHGLSEGKFVLLFLLAEHGSQPPSAMAEMAGVTKATVTGLSDGLVQAGFIKRCNKPDDRRSFHLQLTAKGKKTAAQVTKEHGIWIASLFEKFKPKELDQLEQLLAKTWRGTDQGRTTRPNKSRER